MILNKLSVAHLRGDILGGATAAVVALPLALAFGVASGAGPVAGLYGAICVGFFAALCGGTPAQVSGPTGPMTVVSAAIFTQFASNPAVAFTIIMLAGALQVLFGYLRLGRYINLVPYPVVSGFMSGIGCIIIIQQLDPLLGHPAPTDVINGLSVLPGNLMHPQPHALMAGLFALGICLLMPKRITRIVPATLLALLAGTALVGGWLTDAPALGAIPSALPHWQIPTFDPRLLGQMLTAALVLAALGSIDSLLTSLVADNVTGNFHDSDRELVGQGIGNLAAGLFGGLPGAGATIRTLVNIRSGGTTPLSGITHALVLLAIALGLGALVAYVPYAVLAGILIKVGLDVMDWSYLRRMFRAPVSATACMLVVLALTVLVDVIVAVAIGVVMASLLFAKEMADLQAASIRTIVGTGGAGHAAEQSILTPEESAALAQCQGRVVILHLAGPLSFGAASEMTKRMATAVKFEALVVDLTDVPTIDVSAALALETIIQRARAQRQAVIFAGIRLPVAQVLARLGIDRQITDFERGYTRLQALERARLPGDERHAGLTGQVV